MLFTVKDRILLLNVLPAQGDITTLRLVRRLREECSFSEADHAALRFQTVGQQMTWIPDAVSPKEIECGAKMADFIAKTLKGVSAAGKLTEEHLNLYERFVPEE